MTDRPPRLSLLAMTLWVAVCAVLLANLKIVAVDYREDVVHIWRDLTHSHPYTPTALRWSDTPGPRGDTP